MAILRPDTSTVALVYCSAGVVPLATEIQSVL